MKSVAVIVVVLLAVASGGLGYYIGATKTGSTARDSSTTLGGNFPAYPLWIQEANWTNQNSAKSGWCGEGVSHFSSISGPPYAGCEVAIGPSEAGIIMLNVHNSGGGTSIMFEDSSSNPNVVFFTLSQGCISQPAAWGLCYINGNSTATFTVSFASTAGTYKPMNVSLNVLVAAVSSG
jgi:hypothetical protein